MNREERATERMAALNLLKSHLPYPMNPSIENAFGIVKNRLMSCERQASVIAVLEAKIQRMKDRLRMYNDQDPVLEGLNNVDQDEQYKYALEEVVQVVRACKKQYGTKNEKV